METVEIPLIGSVGVAQAETLHAAAQDAILAGKSIAFQFEDIRDMDASILQILIAAQAASEEQGLTTEFQGVSNALSNALGNAGASFLLPAHETTDSDETVADQN